MSIRIGLLGYGRTGSVVASEIIKDQELSLEWVCRRNINKEKPYASREFGFEENFAPFVTADALNKAFIKKHPVDIIIDFSTNLSSRSYEFFADSNIRIVSAISKYSEEDLQYVKQASLKTAILCSPNITLGINWLMIASKILKQIIPHADIEVVEEHFRDKREVSGTALKLASQLDLDTKSHVNSIRVGGVVGKHEVIFGLPNQTIRLTHESISRSAFGAGAIFAAKWLVGESPGLYSMEQVFHQKVLRKIKEMDL